MLGEVDRPDLAGVTAGVKVVAENTDEELARRRAAEVLGWALRELAANLLRVVRGAGRPKDLGRQAVTFVDTLQTYRNVVGCYPPPRDLEAMIALEAVDTRGWTEEERLEHGAERAILRGALQMAASDLLGQQTQQAAGETEMYDGVNRLIDLCGAERLQWAPGTTKKAEGRAGARTTRKPARRLAKASEDKAK